MKNNVKYLMNGLMKTDGVKSIRFFFSKGNTEYGRMVSWSLVFQAREEDYRNALVYSQTEMDLESHRRVVSKQKVLLFFCVKVY